MTDIGVRTTNGAADLHATASIPTACTETLTEAALRLAAGGWPVFPCAVSKRPMVEHGFLDASTDPKIIRAAFSSKAALIGVPTGPASGMDVLDVDPRHGGDTWEAANRHRLPQTLVHQTGGRGRHWVFRCDPRLRNSTARIAAGVDTRATGGFVIVPPSPGYSIVSELPPAPWPDWLLEPGLALPPTPKERPISSAGPYVPTSDARHEAYRLAILSNVREAADGQKHQALRNAALALGGIAEAAEFSDDEATSWLMNALPPSVRDWNVARNTAAWGLIAGRERPLKLADRNGAHKANGSGAPPQPASLREPEPPPQQPPPEQPKATDKPPPKAKRRGLNVLVLTARMDTKAWRGAIRLNELTAAIEVREPFPPSGDVFNGPFRPLRDPIDTLETVLWFQANGCPSASKGLVFDAITIAAHRARHHPVRAYLDGLKWDGTERAGRLFQHYYNAVMPDEADLKAYDRHVSYLEHTSCCTLVSAVARVKQPGCKVDHLPIVVGIQGGNKSKGLRALCPHEEWFTDDLSPDLIERDTKESLLGKWIIELAEIPHVRKEAERVKAFFSRQADRFRRAYDRNTSDWPRQCVFLGSSNDLEFVDPTGNRRFWPFNVGPINVAQIVADRDQLWAEAIWLYEHDYQWWLPPKLELIAATQQAGYVEADLWEGPLEAWIAANPDGQAFTLLQAMQGGLRFGGVETIPKPEQMRATSCLKRLGYQRGPLRRVGNSRERYWIRPLGQSGTE